MTYFLDTCILLHSATTYDKSYYTKASTLINLDGWLTSDLVYEELKGIRQRREKIYSNVLLYDREKIVGKTLQDYYNNCFKSVLGSNKNDERHIKQLFEICMDALGLKYTHVLKKETIDDFVMELFPKIRNIRVILTQRINDFATPQYYKDHVVAKYYETPAYKPLKSDLYALQDAAQHKQDLLILIDAVAHSEKENKKMEYVTTDAIYDKYRPDIGILVKKHHPTAQLEIRHLKDT
jgi:hypothetical protein